MNVRETVRNMIDRKSLNYVALFIFCFSLSSCSENSLCRNGEFGSNILSSVVNGESSVLYKGKIISVYFDDEMYEEVASVARKSKIRYFYSGVSVESSCKLIKENGVVKLFLFDIKSISPIQDRDTVDRIYASYGVKPVVW